MNTLFLLMSQYDNPLIPLDDVADEYFAIKTKSEADRQAKDHKLPVPAFRLGKQRSQWFIHVEELAKFIDETRLKQKEIWNKMNAA
ncbi:MAG: pyocin activator PrtN family protein [Colwellia sp.]|nr:pyocin activator PrtN family protein [Colwellia sp.]